VKFTPTCIPDIVIVEPRVHADDRGFFMETWHSRRFADAGLDVTFVQDNHSRSAGGVLRGLHYQRSYPQGKLVRVVVGAVFDVAVDLRRSSPTFGQWVTAILSSDNKRQLWVPPGFAHGFYVMSDVAEVSYKCTEFFAPDDERTIVWNDPELAIPWPVDVRREPRLSARDALGARFRDADLFA